MMMMMMMMIVSVCNCGTFSHCILPARFFQIWRPQTARDVFFPKVPALVGQSLALCTGIELDSAVYLNT